MRGDYWIPALAALGRDDGSRTRLLRLLEIVIRPDEILARLRHVAIEADAGLHLVVPGVILGEDAVFPITVALVGRVVGAPALLLAHHGVLPQVGLDETAVRVLLGIALRVELGVVVLADE